MTISAQVLLVWALQQGFSVLPKSTNPIHIEENIRLDFSLDDHDLQKLSSLDLNRKYAWNPDSVV
jgi:diketogulonate reductase-like aldo/keto reductase